MDNERIEYQIDVSMPEGHYVFYRSLRGDEGLSYELWNSKSRTWAPSVRAYDAFCGFYDWSDPITEAEVMRIIAGTQ